MKRFVTGILMAIAFLSASGQDKPLHEVHVAFINNFMKYVQWPADGQAEFVIGIFGDDDVYGILRSWYDGKTKGSQKILVKKLTTPAEAAECSLIYVARKNSRDFEQIKEAIAGKHALTVTDGLNLGAKGSCLNFKIIDGKLKFELNQAAFAASSLKVSGQLSSIAIVI